MEMTNFNPEKVYAAMIKILERKYDVKISYTITKKTMEETNEKGN